VTGRLVAVMLFGALGGVVVVAGCVLWWVDVWLRAWGR
jgi:hypothetical protein